ncbi:MAG: hypothetical protein V3571_04310 [Pseudodesulfovibrio sp.]
MLILAEKITVFSLLHILRHRGERLVVHHFNGVSRLAALLCAVLARLGVGLPPFAKIPRCYGDMRDEDGIHFLKVRFELDRQVAELHARLCAADPLLTRFVRRFSGPEIALKYFHAKLEAEVLLSMRRIVLCAWFAQHNGGAGQCLVLSERCRLFGVLDAVADEYGLRHRGYLGVRTLMEGPVAGTLLLARQLLLFLARHVLGARSGPPAAPAPQRATLVQVYTRSKVCVQNRDKNELFWLAKDDPKAGRVVVTGYDVDCAEPGVLGYWRERGVRFFGRADMADTWVPSRESHRLCLGLAKALARDWIACLGRGRGRVEHAKRMLLLIESYALWTDFFRQHSTRVILSYFFHDHGARLAIRDLDGVAVSCQDSISGYDLQVSSTCHADLELVHSALYSDICPDRSVPVTFLANGYTHPVAEAVRNAAADTRAVRAGLERNGARFILCYFDENMVDQWYFYMHPREGLAMYARLFEALLADDTLGLVCKPKNGEAIFAALHPIQRLLEAAMATGRLRLHSTAAPCRDAYPAVHAAVADLCIGDTSGGTAAFEAALTGVPSILIDPMGRKPRFGGVDLDGRVVFPDMEAALDAVAAYRRASEEQPGFGDWSPWLPTLVASNDGEGARKLSSVIDILLAAFDAGHGRDAALGLVRREYAEAWGRDSVIVKDATGGAQ